MKSVFTIIGVLTLAQWVFVGLLHGFLIMQGKNSPETFHKLHRIPVVGGYFPVVDLPTDEDKEREHADAMRLRLLEAKRDLELPKAFDPETFQELIDEIKTKSSDLNDDRKGLEARESEVQSLIEELKEREETVNARQEKLAQEAERIKLAQRELTLKEASAKGEQDAAERENLQRLATVFEAMQPRLARERLVGTKENQGTEEERKQRYHDAARILTYMNTEVSAAIMEQLDPVEFVRIQQVMKGLPIEK
ncbi:MAG: hypothetical protein V3W41_03895 [Planctomycetota bacterium]